MKTSAIYTLPVTLLALLFLITLTTAQELGPELRPSPDGQELVCWFDHDAGSFVGTIRSILVRSKSDPDMPLFSFAGTSRSTNAAWNSVSTRCVIVNEVDRGRMLVWLVYKEKSGKWHERLLDVIAPIEAAFLKARGDRDLPMFQVHLEKIEWISDTQLRFHVWANGNEPDLASSGTYQVDINAELADAKPTMKRAPIK